MGNISLIEKDIDEVKNKVQKEISNYKSGAITAKELLSRKATIYEDVFKDWYFCKAFSFVPISSNAQKREIFKDLTEEECEELLLRLRKAAGMSLEMFNEVPEEIDIPTNDNNDNWSTFVIDANELVNLEDIKLNEEYNFNLKPKNSKEKEPFSVKFFYAADTENTESLSLQNIPQECYIEGETSLTQKRNYISCDAYRFTGSKAEIYLLGTGTADGYKPFECILTIKKHKKSDQKMILILAPQKDSNRWANFYDWEKSHLQKIEAEEKAWLESL